MKQLDEEQSERSAAEDTGAGSRPQAVIISDLNGDGRPDLAVANFEDPATVSVFVNQGGGGFHKTRDYATGTGTRSVAIGDLNGDGRPELATVNLEANTVSVLVNRGGSFDRRLDFGTRRQPVQLAIGDLNGDARPDLVTADGGPDTASVLLNSLGLCAVQKVKGETIPAARQTRACGMTR